MAHACAPRAALTARGETKRKGSGRRALIRSRRKKSKRGRAFGAQRISAQKRKFNEFSLTVTWYEKFSIATLVMAVATISAPTSVVCRKKRRKPPNVSTKPQKNV